MEIHGHIFYKKDRNNAEYYCLNVVTDKGKTVMRNPNRFDSALNALRYFEKQYRKSKISIESIHAIIK
jgi:hypothetical protein